MTHLELIQRWRDFHPLCHLHHHMPVCKSRLPIDREGESLVTSAQKAFSGECLIDAVEYRSGNLEMPLKIILIVY